jgi:succinyl-CoA synthetase beta subunit
MGVLLRCASVVVQVLVTKQTGPAGKPVNTLYVAQKMKLANEMYFAILLDRASAGPMIIACSEGEPLFCPGGAWT